MSRVIIIWNWDFQSPKLYYFRFWDFVIEHTEPEILFLEDPLAFKDNYIFEEWKTRTNKTFFKKLATFLIEISGNSELSLNVSVVRSKRHTAASCTSLHRIALHQCSWMLNIKTSELEILIEVKTKVKQVFSLLLEKRNFRKRIEKFRFVKWSHPVKTAQNRMTISRTL